MITCIKNRPFLFLTAVSFIFSIFVTIFNLQYDDQGVGAASFLIMYIAGVTRYLARLLLSGFFEFDFDKYKVIAEVAVAIITALILDYLYIKALTKLAIK